MAKIISISDDVYEALTTLKGEGSYSKAIRGLIGGKGNKEKLLGFAGKGGIDAARINVLKHLWGKWSEEYA